MKNLTLDDIKKIVKDFKGNEAMKQYGDHREFLFAGLDEKEEMKSRMAFADAYCHELEEIHRQFMDKFEIGPGENEFAYLNNPNFRKAAGEESSRIIDLMKDYMAYRYYTDKEDSKNRIKAAIINEIFGENGPDTDEEKAFRKQLIPEGEMDFLIENSAYSDEKKQGIRDCRKWMYRNCSKSGAFNLSGTKRNYIDSFGKMPVQHQVNALLQVESKYYKYDDKDGLGEAEAMADSYIPNLALFKENMIKTKFNVFSRPTGTRFHWSRLERAVEKTVDRAEDINQKYNEYKVKGKDNSLEEREAAIRQQRLKDKAMETIETFTNLGKEYRKCLDDYFKNKDRKSEDALKRKGLEIQNFWKNKDNKEILSRAEGESKQITDFINFVKQGEATGKMGDRTITLKTADAMLEKIDSGIAKKNLAATLWGVGTFISGSITKNPEFVNAVSKGFSFLGMITNAYSAIKNTVMARVSNIRRHKAKATKAEIKDEYKAYNKEQTEKYGKANRKVNVMAKVVKKDNMGRTKKYIAAAGCALTALGFGVATIAATTVGLPFTLTGIGVSLAGTIISSRLAAKRDSQLIKKAIDSSAKLDEEFQTIKDDDGNKVHRYIDEKAKERKEILEKKLKRYGEGSKSHSIIDKNIKNPSKVKQRIRTNYAVKKGCATDVSFKAKFDREMVEEAYRNIFLKDPEGPITDDNLIPIDEFDKYMSTKENDRESDVIKNSLGREQSLQEARLRVQYKELLEAEGVKIKVPENANEAKRMFHSKNKEAGNNENKKSGNELKRHKK
ncbi:MAG: hypothetical protein IKR70_05035 [Lachnospiraceae bacterium]|nr:hypothetical protein [Lachnospiraceae bacterium]